MYKKATPLKSFRSKLYDHTHSIYLVYPAAFYHKAERKIFFFDIIAPLQVPLHGELKK